LAVRNRLPLSALAGLAEAGLSEREIETSSFRSARVVIERRKTSR